MAYQPISVIGSQYCVPNCINLRIDTEKGVIYKDGNVVFHVTDTFFTLHKRRVLCDVGGNPIVTLYNKKRTLHERCRVFKGKNNDPNEMLFSVKRSSMIQGSDLKLDVFLANNVDESVCDFKVVVGNCRSLCTIYAGEYSIIVAKMENNGGLFDVLVHPNVDYAFIVALLMIVDKMEDWDAIVDLALQVTIDIVISLLT